MTGTEISGALNGIAKQPYVMVPTGLIVLVVALLYGTNRAADKATEAVSLESIQMIVTSAIDAAKPEGFDDLQKSVFRSEAQLESMAEEQKRSNEINERILAAYTDIQIELRGHSGDIENMKEDIGEIKQRINERYYVPPFVEVEP